MFLQIGLGAPAILNCYLIGISGDLLGVSVFHPSWGFGPDDPLQAPGLHCRERSPTVTYVWPGTGDLTWRKYTHKPHATCKADMVLILASVVLLSFLFLCEWIFIFGSDFCFGSWFVVCICHHSSWVWPLGKPSGQGSGPMGSVRRRSLGTAFPRSMEVVDLLWSDPWRVTAEPLSLFLSWILSCHTLPHLGFLLSLSVLLT